MAIASGPNIAVPTDIVRVFTTSGVFTPSFTGNVEVLVVAGGGGGGMDMGGGGGGGGVISNSRVAVTAGSPITVTVGAGGFGAPAGSGGYRTDGAGPQPNGHQFTISATNGSNSVFGSLTAVGGGYGGSSYFAYTPNNGYGNSGGSGGGASGYSDGNTGRGGAGTSNQGNAGGGSIGQYYSGGGGGAGAAGSSTGNGNGGAGVLNTILNSNLYWAGGGGGSAYSNSIGGIGGIGGGGGGAIGATTGGVGYNSGSPGGGGGPGQWAQTPGGNGGQNTGGGGGGGSHYNATNKGGEGGSGIVIVRYPASLGSSTGGASISLEDLIFAYDMDNIQSFRGAVATNQFAVPTPDGSNNVVFQVQGTGTFQRVYSGTFGGYTITNNDVVYRYDLVAAGGCYYHGNDVTINSGQWATFTFDYYISPGAGGYPVTNFLANFEGVLSNSVADPTPSITGVWKTATFSAQAGSTGLCRMLLYPGACNGTSLATSGFILYKNPQVVISSSSNTTVPFVGPFGARSSTQAIQDLTGINSVTVNALTYNSTGTTFSFNGTNNSIMTPTLQTLGNSMTWEAWVNCEQDISTYNMFMGRYLPYFSFYGGVQLYFSNNISGAQQTIATAGNLSLNTWYMATFSTSFDGTNTTMKIFTNGVETATGTFSGSQGQYAGVNFMVGDGNNGNNTNWYPFKGRVSNVKVYNRTLSADEILQNFNATRSRYGV
jgi:hypothetical protein